MFAKSVLVTGSNRGIGLALIKHLVCQTQHLFAGCRSPDQAEELKTIAEAHKHVVILQLDVSQENEIASAVAKITEIVGDEGLNCLINNAGINCIFNNDGTRDLSQTSIETLSVEGLSRLYEINAIAPAMLVKACLPLLRKASCQCSDNQMRVSRASILSMSTTRSTISDNTAGGRYAYRMSKVALNMLTKNLSIELKPDHILAVNLNPGWVQTKMGGPKALISPAESVEGMLKIASNFTEKDSGMFYSWDGTVVPW